MALTCSVLHNICEEHGDSFTEELLDRHENVQTHGHTFREHGNREGTDIRAALMGYFNRGES